jgi:hypothetical protein
VPFEMLGMEAVLATMVETVLQKQMAEMAPHVQALMKDLQRSSTFRTNHQVRQVAFGFRTGQACLWTWIDIPRVNHGAVNLEWQSVMHGERRY